MPDKEKLNLKNAIFIKNCDIFVKKNKFQVKNLNSKNVSDCLQMYPNVSNISRSQFFYINLIQ